MRKPVNGYWKKNLPNPPRRRKLRSKIADTRTGTIMVMGTTDTATVVAMTVVVTAAADAITGITAGAVRCRTAK